MTNPSQQANKGSLGSILLHSSATAEQSCYLGGPNEVGFVGGEATGIHASFNGNMARDFWYIMPWTHTQIHLRLPGVLRHALQSPQVRTINCLCSVSEAIAYSWAPFGIRITRNALPILHFGLTALVLHLPCALQMGRRNVRASKSGLCDRAASPKIRPGTL